MYFLFSKSKYMTFNLFCFHLPTGNSQDAENDINGLNGAIQRKGADVSIQDTPWQNKNPCFTSLPVLSMRT